MVSAVKEWCWSSWWSGCQEGVIRPAFSLQVVSHQQAASAGVQTTVFLCSSLFAKCLPACLPRRERENTRTMTVHNRCGRLARQASCPISVWQGRIFVFFPGRDAGVEGHVSAGRFRGLYRLISASVRRRLVASDWHHRIAKGAGTCQLARKKASCDECVLPARLKIDSSGCLGPVKATQLASSQYGTACAGHGHRADGSFARETWIIVVKLNGRASESDH